MTVVQGPWPIEDPDESQEPSEPPPDPGSPLMRRFRTRLSTGAKNPKLPSIEQRRNARRRKLDKLFQGKHFRIAAEIKLEDDDFVYDVFGNRAQQGYWLENVDDPVDNFIVGRGVLLVAWQEYGSVSLPVQTSVQKRIRLWAKVPIITRG